MTWICALLAALLVTALPAAGWAAPQGKVVVAQGVDPTTLDPMNHQETPAGNVCRNIFDTLLERDQDLKIQPALARELPKLVAPTVWEFKLNSPPWSGLLSTAGGLVFAGDDQGTLTALDAATVRQILTPRASRA